MIAGRRTWVLALALAGSVAGNLIVARQALRFYRDRVLCGLRTAPSTAFERENRSLGPPRPGRPRIVYFGDSRIADWARLPDVEPAESINRGHAGDTTALARARLRRDVLDLKPAIVVLQVGINDLKAIRFLPDLAVEILASAEQNVAAILADLRAQRIEVILLTVWPRGPGGLLRLPVPWRDVDRAIADLNARLVVRGGPGVAVVDCGALLGAGGRLDPRFSRDMVHLNDQGYARLNERLGVMLAAVVGRAASSP